MVGSLSAGLLLADEAGAHLPSVDDFLPPEILFQGTPFAINCGLPMVVMAVVQRDVRMGLYGVMSLLFALSDVLQLFLVGGCWAAPSGHDVRFEDAAGRWVYEGQLRADTVRHGVIPDRSNHQERHEILRVESFDGDVKAVQSFLNEHDAGYIAEVTPEQPIIVEALGNKACVYVTKIVQCELRDVLRLLEAK